MFRPIIIQDIRYACVHWKTMPPAAAAASRHLSMSLEDLWKSRKLASADDYQRAMTWRRICGKFTMDEHCLDCPHIRRLEIRNQVPCLVSLDGKTAVPQINLLNIERYFRVPAWSNNKGTKR